MPAEAVHLTALYESTLGTFDPLPREISSLLVRHKHLARFGAVLVELGYFEASAPAMLRRVLGLGARPSGWGARIHRAAPHRLLDALLSRVQDGRADHDRGGPGRDAALALALGCASHLAVDRVAEPMIDNVARARARILRTDEDEERRRVEKFQWVLFQQRYFGRDLLGHASLAGELDVPVTALVDDDRVWALVSGALREAVGASPARSEVRAWARAYRSYVQMLASPMGRLFVPERAREDAYDIFYRNGSIDFDQVFGDARKASRALVEATYGETVEGSARS